VERKCWVKNWVRRRDRQGAYTQLVSELQLTAVCDKRKVYRLST